MSEDKIPEKEIAGFFTGFSLYFRFIRDSISVKDSDDLNREVIRLLCPSLTVDDFEEITCEFVLVPEFFKYCRIWDFLCICPDAEVHLTPAVFETPKISQEVIYAVFLGYTNCIRENMTRSIFHKVRNRFLKKIVKMFCKDIDPERLLDIEFFFYGNKFVIELQERIIHKVGIHAEWSKEFYEEEPAETEEELMIKNFQEKYR